MLGRVDLPVEQDDVDVAALEGFGDFLKLALADEVPAIGGVACLYDCIHELVAGGVDKGRDLGDVPREANEDDLQRTIGPGPVAISVCRRNGGAGACLLSNRMGGVPGAHSCGRARAVAFGHLPELPLSKANSFPRAWNSAAEFG